jgi:hypothetical protein
MGQPLENLRTANRALTISIDLRDASRESIEIIAKLLVEIEKRVSELSVEAGARIKELKRGVFRVSPITWLSVRSKTSKTPEIKLESLVKSLRRSRRNKQKNEPNWSVGNSKQPKPKPRHRPLKLSATKPKKRCVSHGIKPRKKPLGPS